MRFFFKKRTSHTFLDPDEILADSVHSVGSLFASEGKLERPIGKISYSLFLAAISLGVLYLVLRAGALQIQWGEAHFLKSQENRFFSRPVFPARGVIYDRFGKPLVENYPSFGVIFEKEEFLARGGDLSETIPLLARILQKPEGFFYEAGFPAGHETGRLPKRIVLAQGISSEEIVSLAPALYAVSGVQIFEEFRRGYGYPFALSHLIGFVGKVSESDLARNSKLLPQDTIGKSGIELAYDELLRGKAGKKIVETDASGTETRFKLIEEPEPGQDIHLTMDGDLQRVAYETIAHYTQGKKGASLVALDPRDGSVRALISFPGFDSGRLGYSISAGEFQAVLADPLKPLFNRAIAGEFPSGSVIKPLYGAAALQENIIDPQKQIHDIGFIEIPNPYVPGEKSVFVDWKKGGHGWVDFYDAIAQSVNVYFYMIGGGYKDQPGLGIERLKKYALAFGLGSLLGIDIPGEKPGLFPDPEWKKSADPKNPIWRIGDTYNVSIGQGGVKVTPLQMAAATAALANGGKLYQPHISSAAENRLLNEGMVSRAVLAEVMKGMRQTATEGTARLLSFLPVAVAAKTGTAETGAGLPHAWVTAVVPAENPELVMAVMVENAGEGSTVAVPITHDILQWYFANRN